jgi:hypothetical protein
VRMALIALFAIMVEGAQRSDGLQRFRIHLKNPLHPIKSRLCPPSRNGSPKLHREVQMPWYRVTKKINGRLYDYWQRTYRIGNSPLFNYLDTETA